MADPHSQADYSDRGRAESESALSDSEAQSGAENLTAGAEPGASEAEWGLAPKRTGMGWETKLGLVVILLLVTAFGYLLVRKLQQDKTGDDLAAKEAAESTVPAEPEPSLESPPEQDPFAEPAPQEPPALADNNEFEPDQFEPAAEFEPEAEFEPNNSFDPATESTSKDDADPFAAETVAENAPFDPAETADPFQEQVTPARAQPVEFTEFESEAETEEGDEFDPQPVRQAAETASPFESEPPAVPAKPVSQATQNEASPFGDYQPVAETSTSASSTTKVVIKPGTKTEIPKNHPARAGSSTAGASPFEVTTEETAELAETEESVPSSLSPEDPAEAMDEFDPDAVASDGSLDSEEFDPGTESLFDPAAQEPDPTRTATNERPFEQNRGRTPSPARTADPFGEYEVIEEVEVRAGGTTQVVRPGNAASRTPMPGYTTPPARRNPNGTGATPARTNSIPASTQEREPAPATISLDEFEPENTGDQVPNPVDAMETELEASPFEVLPERVERRPTRSADATPSTNPLAGTGEATYVVQPNDNYWKISKTQYGTGRYFQALAKHNQSLVPDPRHMRPGITIATPAASALEVSYPNLIPKGSQTTNYRGEVTSTKPTAPAGFFVNQGQPMYRVGSNDTLSSIAQQHLGRASRWFEIYQINEANLAGPDRLKIGSVLTLPADASQHRVVRAAPESRY